MSRVNRGGSDAWETKLARYHEFGVRELVRFDPADPPGARLRVWDRVQEDLVERVVEDERTPCLTLGLVWALAPIDAEVVGLRLADAEGRLLESKEESLRREREEEARGREAEARGREAEARGREVEARGREAEARGRAEAEARVRELEERLRRLGG